MFATATCSFFLILGCVRATENSTESSEVNSTFIHDTEVRLKNDLLQNYSMDVLPPHAPNSPLVMQIGASLILLKELDAKTQTSNVELWLKLLWEDSRLKWNSTEYGGIQVIRTATNRIWHPDLHIYNSGDMKEFSKIDASVNKLFYPDGTVVWVPPLTTNTLCEIDLKNYPYDTHVCTWKIGSWTHDGDHLDLALYENTRTVGLEDYFDEGGEWEILSTSACLSSVKDECCNATYKVAIFSVTVLRRSPFYTAYLVSPLIAATFLLLISLFISPMIIHCTMLRLVALFTSLTLLMRLSSSLPEVGNSTPLIMKVYGILLMISAMATIITLVFKAITSSKSPNQIPEWISKVVQSRYFNILFIRTGKTNVNSRNHGDSSNLVSDVGPVSSSTAISSARIAAWTALFQAIERIFFIGFVITIISVSIAFSGSEHNMGNTDCD